MQKKPWFSCLLVSTLALLGSAAGIVSGGLLYGSLLPFWTITSLGQITTEVVDILFVDYQYAEAVHLEGNTLFVQSQTGAVYSVFESKSQLLSPLPNGQATAQIWLRNWEANAPIVAVATDGQAYQLRDEQWELIESHIESFKGFTPTPCSGRWYLPVVGVRDSAGMVFSHALADEYVCYLLFKDGRLQVWTRTLDAFSLMAMLVASAGVGLVAGLKALPVIHRFRKMHAKENVLVT